MAEGKWMWCELCGCVAYICPKCGNNCCNGSYGKVDGEQCPACPDSYDYQQRMFDENKAPSRDECEGVIRKPTFLE